MDYTQKINDIISRMTLEEKSRLCMGKNDWSTQEFPQYGIPAIMMTDGTNGVRYNKPEEEVRQMLADKGLDPNMEYNFFDVTLLNQKSDKLDFIYPATCFPSGSALGASWDKELVAKVAKAVAEECKAKGLSLLLSPGMNIRRSPLGGRSFEYFSEDPVVSGEIAGAYVDGLQKNGVGGTIKHYTCNHSETLRTRMDSIVEERALREIYLAGFERALRVKPVSVMSSYNLLNGVQMAENKRLLRDILRQEWGFEGFVVSDWWGIKDRVAAAIAGNDMEMPFNGYNLTALSDAVQSGLLDLEVLDEMCANILRFVFDAQDKLEPGFEADFTANHQVARQALAESCVLLKNEDSVLPLDPQRTPRILVVGQIAKDMRYQGGGSALINPTRLDQPYDEIVARCGSAAQVTYVPGYQEDDTTTPGLLQQAEQAAKENDVVILFAGLAVSSDAEGADRTTLSIEPGHIQLIETLGATGAPLVVVLSNGAEVVMPWLDHAKAVLEIFMCGQAGGSAVADVLFGQVNPSGKLTTTFPQQLEDLAAFPEFPGENHRNVYGEGIYVGYRYFDAKKIPPQFCFGHGLSYTTFLYRDLQVFKPSITDQETLQVSLRVENTGRRAGKEVVQLYVAPPTCRLRRPVKELKAFAKIHLEPQECKTLEFALSYRDFAYYDPEFSDWVVDTGEYGIWVGASSQDIRQKALVHVQSTIERHVKIQLDTVHVELFKDKKATQLYFDWMVERGIFTREDINDKLMFNLNQSFVGLYNTLAFYTDTFISKEEYQQFLDRLNHQLGR